MSELTFKTKDGQTVDRALLILYLNTGTSEAPVWAPVGKRVEDSSAEYDWGKESKTDIFGDVYTSLKKPTITQSFDPCELDGGDKAQLKIWNMAIKNQDVQGLSNLDMLMVHLYAVAEDKPFAERYGSCCVTPTSLGGSGGGNIGMPIEVTFGGERTTGTATVDASGVVTFAPNAA